jgi:hypothetical protein
LPSQSEAAPRGWLVVSEKAGDVCLELTEAGADIEVANVVKEYGDAYGKTSKLPLYTTPPAAQADTTAWDAGYGLIKRVLANKDWCGPAEHFKPQEEVVQTRTLKQLMDYELSNRTTPAAHGVGDGMVVVPREPPFPKEFLAMGVRTENGVSKTVYLDWTDEGGGWHQWTKYKAQAKQFKSEKAALDAAKHCPGPMFNMPAKESIAVIQVEGQKAKQYRAMLQAASAPGGCDA